MTCKKFELIESAKPGPMKACTNWAITRGVVKAQDAMGPQADSCGLLESASRSIGFTSSVAGLSGLRHLGFGLNGLAGPVTGDGQKMLESTKEGGSPHATRIQQLKGRPDSEGAVISLCVG